MNLPQFLLNIYKPGILAFMIDNYFIVFCSFIILFKTSQILPKELSEIAYSLI